MHESTFHLKMEGEGVLSAGDPTDGHRLGAITLLFVGGRP